MLLGPLASPRVDIKGNDEAAKTLVLEPRETKPVAVMRYPVRLAVAMSKLARTDHRRCVAQLRYEE